MPRSDGLRIWGFWKKLGVDFGPCRQTIGLSASMADSWSWGLTMMWRSWGPTMMLRSWGPTMVLKNRVGFRPLKDVVSIRENFKNCVSLLVSKNRTQKLKNSSYLNKGVACVFESAYCVLYLRVLQLLLILNNGCGTQHPCVYPFDKIFYCWAWIQQFFSFLDTLIFSFIATRLMVSASNIPKYLYITIIIIIPCEVFTPSLVDSLSQKSGWRQVSSSLQDSSQYSGRS